MCGPSNCRRIRHLQDRWTTPQMLVVARRPPRLLPVVHLVCCPSSTSSVVELCIACCRAACRPLSSGVSPVVERCVSRCRAVCRPLLSGVSPVVERRVARCRAVCCPDCVSPVVTHTARPSPTRTACRPPGVRVARRAPCPFLRGVLTVARRVNRRPPEPASNIQSGKSAVSTRPIALPPLARMRAPAPCANARSSPLRECALPLLTSALVLTQDPGSCSRKIRARACACTRYEPFSRRTGYEPFSWRTGYDPLVQDATQSDARYPIICTRASRTRAAG
ncbi:hypothetical protein BD626DRAFT_206885 [Schizophyllum amplum]|uniref:Uncharacterized protein n=1 Tax=Schizophyllum amplum TaxID=97359 RepID=A0A550BYR5_9AGAR|nr:hypothetical protein BD626DRAFT_206885 [Auriculariopsis ampla]